MYIIPNYTLGKAERIYSFIIIKVTLPWTVTNMGVIIGAFIFQFEVKIVIENFK